MQGSVCCFEKLMVCSLQAQLSLAGPAAWTVESGLHAVRQHELSLDPRVTAATCGCGGEAWRSGEGDASPAARRSAASRSSSARSA